MRWLITGGAGFIGTNTVLGLHGRGEEIEIIDDLSRPGVLDNSTFIKLKTNLHIHEIDITDNGKMANFLGTRKEFDVILNLAGQVSLMESIRNPLRDFAVNTSGPLSLMEYLRIFSPETMFINMSSNKVYGSLEYLKVSEEGKRYKVPGYENGFTEETKLDFHGPYGCSKGAADQYLNDYRRIYGLNTVSFRQSAVYGPFQKPQSDQGWLAFMIEEIIAGRTIQLNGVGKQVRDLLYVEDLVELFFALSRKKQLIKETSFNVGGGPLNQLSILELFDYLADDYGLSAKFDPGELRPGDQKFFISNTDRISALTGWRPATTIKEGIRKLIDNL
ncbi:GDP-mannose 4,6-dehydratase [Candidatus Planktophila dulcis]|uniref:GDP-mannose 4,6-dehydratase n=1 Tax=Candidatus Planktophila dulcis TaxID=1884914 RepID=UPI003BEECD63